MNWMNFSSILMKITLNSLIKNILCCLRWTLGLKYWEISLFRSSKKLRITNIFLRYTQMFESQQLKRNNRNCLYFRKSLEKIKMLKKSFLSSFLLKIRHSRRIRKVNICPNSSLSKDKRLTWSLSESLTKFLGLQQRNCSNAFRIRKSLKREFCKDWSNLTKGWKKYLSVNLSRWIT